MNQTTIRKKSVKCVLLQIRITSVKILICRIHLNVLYHNDHYILQTHQMKMIEKSIIYSLSISPLSCVIQNLIFVKLSHESE